MQGIYSKQLVMFSDHFIIAFLQNFLYSKGSYNIPRIWMCMSFTAV